MVPHLEHRSNYNYLFFKNETKSNCLREADLWERISKLCDIRLQFPTLYSPPLAVTFATLETDYPRCLSTRLESKGGGEVGGVGLAYWYWILIPSKA